MSGHEFIRAVQSSTDRASAPQRWPCAEALHRVAIIRHPDGRNTSARTHQRASRPEGPCVCLLCLTPLAIKDSQKTSLGQPRPERRRRNTAAIATGVEQAIYACDECAPTLPSPRLRGEFSRLSIFKFRRFLAIMAILAIARQVPPHPADTPSNCVSSTQSRHTCRSGACAS